MLSLGYQQDGGVVVANQEQLKVLRQGAEVWNEWRLEHPNIAVDLREADLQGADLQGANLHHANLIEASLYGTDLTEANLTQADLIEADLQGANLQGANLHEANLHGADLTRADLRGAYLHGADLAEANLRWASFREANLFSADLQGVDLQGAVLVRANLHEANLFNADLQGVNFHGSNLQRVNMANVRMGGTIFGNVDLQTVQGLTTVNHIAPSTIGLDTIEQSHGVIPEIFLRGAGVAERIIEYLPSLTAQVIQFYSCFISYSHADKLFARRLHDALQGRGIRCWLDEHQLLPGHSIYDEVDRGIRLWDKVLLCASQHSLTSWWVDNEIDKTFVKEQQFTKERGTKIRALIPLNLDGALWKWRDGKADQVRSRLVADFTGWEHDNAKFEHELERLVKALRTDEGREDPPTPKL